MEGRKESSGLKALGLSRHRMEPGRKAWGCLRGQGTGKQPRPQGAQAPGGKLALAVDCGFHPPPGAPYPLPQLPLWPLGGAGLVCFPLCHPFYDGEGWFSPNPADTSSLCLAPALPPWEAPRQPPEMSLQDRTPATRSSSQMGPERGSGSPLVTRHVVNSRLWGCISSVPQHSPGRRRGGTSNSFHISHGKTGAPRGA